jgi:hypothetical protein
MLTLAIAREPTVQKNQPVKERPKPDLLRHPRESGGPASFFFSNRKSGIPAFAGMTDQGTARPAKQAKSYIARLTRPLPASP